ncbi:MAG: hypothetical protein FJW66_08810, partial [Actinobacteria bacterium]|nr:hypothetical protein [Actinomycetota bacterium]
MEGFKLEKSAEKKATFPVIPEGEFEVRWKKVQDLLARKKLDLLIAYSDDHAVFGAAYARWLADFPVHFEPVCIILSREGKPQLFCGPESEEYALNFSKIKEVLAIREFSHPDEDYPYSRIFSLKTLLKEKSKKLGGIKRVGIAGMDLINYEFYLILRNAFHEADFINIDKDLTMLRAIKSPA